MNAAIITISDDDSPEVDLVRIPDRQHVCGCEIARALRMAAEEYEQECRMPEGRA
ncbi:hypothetical protein [Nocardia cyriacigeorgica]|uniref:hypothetical protein n=1 Tax=Nocardia cyriacigeorgica TaxID=135487 RepID=UPI0014861ED4|nr:hypothetical protein [Nocardia cyriacigeorgica]